MALTAVGLSTEGALNGVTPVTLVAAPAAATTRLVKTITISNTDTAPVTVTLNKVVSAVNRQLCKVTLDVNDTLIWDDVIGLDDVNSSITAVMSGAPATTQPAYSTTSADAT